MIWLVKNHGVKVSWDYMKFPTEWKNESQNLVGGAITILKNMS